MALEMAMLGCKHRNQDFVQLFRVSRRCTLMILVIPLLFSLALPEG